MAETIDARGLSCPGPVIMVKDALDARTDKVVVVLVDEEVAKENVSRLASSYGCEVDVADQGRECRLTLRRGGVQ